MQATKKFILLLTLVLANFLSGCGGNEIVTEVIPQYDKQDYFSSFEDEKDFMEIEAIKAIKKMGETPISIYRDSCHYSKTSNYSAFMGAFELKSGKLANVHIQYKMNDTAKLHKLYKDMSDAEIKRISAEQISKVKKYKSIPEIYAANVSLSDNYYSR